MKVFFSFNMEDQARICHAMARYWSEKNPKSKFAGMYVAKDCDIPNQILHKDEVKYEFLDSYEALIEEAVKTPASENEVQLWENKLRSGLQDIIVADRQIGREYVKGGLLPDIVLSKMMNHDLQRSIVVFLLNYYERQLRKFGPDLVFLPAAAAAHSVALSKVCQWMNIPVVTACSSLLPGRIQLCHGVIPSQAKYKRTRVECERIDVQREKELLEYHHKFTAEMPPLPSWSEAYFEQLEKLKKTSSVKRRLRLYRKRITALFSQILFPPKGYYERFPASYWNVRLMHEQAQTTRMAKGFEDPKDEKFVLYPLHVDPEASTMVLAPNFTDQIAAIEALSRSIPLSHKLYVKDHQVMVGRRPYDFYSRIKELHNVRLISPWVNSMELMRKSSLVVSVTGSCCWEASLLSIPSLLMGSPNYPVGNAVVQCSDLKRLPQQIYSLIGTHFDSDGMNRIMVLDSWCVNAENMAMWSRGNADENLKTAKSLCEGLENMIAGFTPRGDFLLTGNDDG